MSKKRINVFITGARGFIGKNLVEYLNTKHPEKYSLFYPYHNDLELLDTARVSKFIITNKIDIILHCASVGGTRKTAYDIGKTDIISKNLRIFFNLTHSLSMVKRVINFGTGAEYDMRHYKPCMPENYFDTFIPEDNYSFSKYVIAKYIENSEKIVNLRLFGVFGRYEDYEFKFISNSILKNLFGLPIIINQNVYFDYLYINDLMGIIEYFINHDAEHKVYNVVNGKTVDLVTIANKINKIAKRPSEIIVKNRGLNTEYSADNKRLLVELGGFRFTRLDKALRELYFWYKKNIKNIDPKVIEKDEYIKYCRVRK
ncbi:MAG: NAD(P)-dependent oxidoreductase [Candidatus Omnitrophica bacterium]|nr:NAD(P)-dependent oxidoreductase [Candidatus Omnitrophota bacterium]